MDAVGFLQPRYTATTPHPGRFYRPRKRIYRRVKGKFHTHLTMEDGSGAAIHGCDPGTVTFTAKLRKR